MQQRNVGKSGLRVSLVGLGCNNFGWVTDLAASRKVVEKALDSGITLFDTADGYGRGASEEQLGKILGDRRKSIVLATKFWAPMDDDEMMRGCSRRYIMLAVEASLRRLRTDWIDLYQLHRPDSLTPIEETLRALDDLVHQGKVRYIGCSWFSAWQVVEAYFTARQYNLHGFVSCQDEYNLLMRDPDRELLPAMQAHGLGFLPYFPLAAGFLTGKYDRRNMPQLGRLSKSGTPGFANVAQHYLTEANWQKVEALSEFCAKRGHTLLELAFSWLAARPTVASIIAGATQPEQIERNVVAAKWVLSPEEMAEVDNITGVPTTNRAPSYG
ncbi:MAG: aldo/keto reductase [Proteobacteria bacterium]|nr:aldo/keto reductase [Pseudomonadota bacterium]